MYEGESPLDSWLHSIGKESVQTFQDDFSGLTDISLCLVHADGSPATVASNRSLFCFRVESCNSSRCAIQHRQLIGRMIESRTAIIDTCYAGLTCFACPLFRSREIIGAFFGGMVLSEETGSITEADIRKFEITSMQRYELENILRLLTSTLALLRGVRVANNSTIDETGRELMRDFGLTTREIMVVAQIIQNHSNHDIADTLFISEKTVKTHITNILKKTSAKNRYEIALICGKYFEI